MAWRRRSSGCRERGCPRWLAAWGLVAAIVGTSSAFLVLTWSSLSAQVRNLGQQLAATEALVLHRLPAPIVEMLKRSGATADASALAPYAMAIGEEFFARLRRLRARLDPGRLSAGGVGRNLSLGPRLRAGTRTARASTARRRKRARSPTATSSATSPHRSVPRSISLPSSLLLKVPAALLLAMLAFVCDFVPVIGFFVSMLPALAMAGTVSAATALALIPIYLGYHFLENYGLARRCMADRLRLSNIAVLLAFAVGAELAGVAARCWRCRWRPFIR